MDSILIYLLFSVGFNLFLFLIAYVLQTDKITDLSYSLTFVILAIASFLRSGQDIVDILLLSLILIWAFRLGSYLFKRIHRIGRDERFDKIRVKFTSFLTFWIMQGLTCFIVIIPVFKANEVVSKDLQLVTVIGLVLAIQGLLIETIADKQKYVYKLKHPDKHMHEGLWYYLQHPNYTGELLFWWGIFISSIPFIGFGIGIIGPLWISLIIIKFSGISILQKKWTEKYGQNKEFQAYHKKTKKLIPFIY